MNLGDSPGDTWILPADDNQPCSLCHLFKVLKAIVLTALLIAAVVFRACGIAAAQTPTIAG
jgi:hypothetical protein